MKVVVIGGGIAGLSCVRKIREMERDSEVVILSEEKRPYSKIILPYLLAGEIKEKDMGLEIPPGVTFRHQKVLKVLPDQNTVVTAKGGLLYDRLLIASGAGAVVPEFEGSTSGSVFVLRNLSDVRGIKKRLKQGKKKRVVISGAGPVSLEAGDALWKLDFTPLFLVTSPRILSTVLDRNGSDALMEGLPKGEMEIHFGETIKRVEAEKEGVSVETETGWECKGDLVISGKGISPNLEFLSSSGIKFSQGVWVDEFLRTNKQDIFAAGDVCQSYDILLSENRVNALWPVAIEQGRCAAANMIGVKVPYKGSMARNIITVFGNTVFTAGLSNWEGLETYHKRERGRYSRISLRNGRLVGVIFINVKIDAGVYLFAMENGLEVHTLRNILLSGGLSYSHLYKKENIWKDQKCDSLNS